VVDPPRQRSIEKAELVSASGQFSCPPAGNSMAVYGQDLTAADTSRRESAGTSFVVALRAEVPGVALKDLAESLTVEEAVAAFSVGRTSS
jgi:hypothetical protein